MYLSGIGVLQAQLYQQQSTQDPLQQILLNQQASLYQTPYDNASNGSVHIEIQLKDGTKISIDYGMSQKTSFELGRYGNYTYGNDLYSPQNTADRILDFARSLWDGSQEKLDVLANAIDKGISEARKLLGNIPDWLNTILSQTEDLVHKGLQDMQNKIKAAA
jgi:hypothetical protein